MAIAVKTLNGDTASIAEEEINAFVGGLRGKLIRRDDDGYDKARTPFNSMIERKPALIIQCAGVADIIHTVRLARDHKLLVAVKGTGHNITGSAICDGGVVIDLTNMKGMHIDPAECQVRAEPGLTWGELNHDLQVFGLTTTGGFISTTGVGGLTLGGGLGWLIRKHGLACDNLLSVDIVTAEGELVTASANHNIDLFWAVRGGGGNFGVVASFLFRVHPAGNVLAGMLAHSINRAADEMRSWRNFSLTAPEELTSSVALMTAPPAPFVPKEFQGSPIFAFGGVYCGDGKIEVGENILRPLRETDPIFDIIQPMPCNKAQSMMDDSFPAGRRNYWKSSILNELTDDAIETIIAQFATVPSPLSIVMVTHNGHGAMNNVDPVETSFGHRDWSYDILICSHWTDPAEDDKNIEWAREFWTAMQPFARDAVYVNYLGSEGEDRVKEAYALSTYERLVKIKTKYDPTNLFRLNHNIRPKM